MRNTSFSSAKRDAVSMAKKRQQTFDVRRTIRGNHYASVSTDPIIEGHIHVATVHCDGRINMVVADLVKMELDKIIPTKKVYTLKEVIEELEAMMRYTRKQLDDWKTRFEANPCYALDWSARAFADAAMLDLLTTYLDWVKGTSDMDPEEFLKRVVTTLDKEIDRVASRIPSSTSVTSNLMENEKRSQSCKLRDEFARFAGMPRRF